MPKLTTLQAVPWQHVLLFGAPKSGKTQLAGELAKHGFNLVWFDLESGSATLRQLPQEAQEKITVVQIPDSPTFPVAVETCLKIVKPPVIPGTYHLVCSTHGKVACPQCAKDGKPSDSVNMYLPLSETIYVFDSVTQLVNSAMNFIAKGKPEDYKFDWEDWGYLGKIMDRFLAHIQTVPAHVICISHETEVEMEDGKLKLVATAGTRNFSRNSAKYFDHVVYVEVRNKKHAAGSSTTYSNNILTGSRLNAAIENSTEQLSLVDIFRGKVGSAQVQPAIAKNLAASLTLKKLGA